MKNLYKTCGGISTQAVVHIIREECGLIYLLNNRLIFFLLCVQFAVGVLRDYLPPVLTEGKQAIIGRVHRNSVII